MSLVNREIISRDLIYSPEVAKGRTPLQAGLGHYVGIFKGLESVSGVPPSQWVLTESGYLMSVYLQEITSLISEIQSTFNSVFYHLLSLNCSSPWFQQSRRLLCASTCILETHLISVFAKQIPIQLYYSSTTLSYTNT